MPFKSEKQRRYLHINKPSIAKAWEKKYGLGGLLDTKKIPKFKKGGFDYEGEAYGTKSSNKGSDHSHSRFDVGSGYYGEKKTNVNKSGNGSGSTKTNVPDAVGPSINTGTLSATVPSNFAHQKYTKELLNIEKKKKEMSTLQKFRHKGMKKFTERTKASNLKELGVVDKKFDTIGGIPIGFTGAFAEAFHIPKETSSFDKDSIREIGSQLSKSKTGMTKSQSKSLGDLRQDIEMEDRLKAGKVSQTDFNKYMNRNKPPRSQGGDNDNVQRCPDGTMPPCVTKPVSPVTQKKKNTFLEGFQAYDKGGLTRTIPPTRGPNPQVPPVKMRKGKMTKKYLNSCPHRPDGIRGMGKAIKGHKFVGTR